MFTRRSLFGLAALSTASELTPLRPFISSVAAQGSPMAPPVGSYLIKNGATITCDPAIGLPLVR